VKSKPSNYLTKTFDSKVETYRQRLLVGTPTTGQVRMEWAVARYAQAIPTNFSKVDMLNYVSGVVPIRYSVADAQNVIVNEAVTMNYEWLMLIEHDTMPPPDGYIQFNDYMRKAQYPVVSGLYFTRSHPAEPLIYRGLGNSYYTKWKLGDKIEVDGVPTGMLLIHCKLLKALWEDCEEYSVDNRLTVRRVFDSPAKTWFNTETGAQETLVGTSDLNWCGRIIEGGYLAKAGWPELQKKKYPFIVDTNIKCNHIDPDGVQFPIGGIEAWCAKNGNL